MNGVRRKTKSPNLAWARGTKYGNQNVDDEVIFSIACVREVTGLEKKNLQTSTATIESDSIVCLG